MGKEGKKAREKESRKQELVTSIVDMSCWCLGSEWGARGGRSWSLWSAVKVNPPGFADGRDVGDERGHQMIIKCFA